MKIWKWFFGFLLFLLIGFAGAQRTLLAGKPLPDRASRPADSLIVHFPEDERLARKELHRARRSLARMQPTRPYIIIDTYSNRLFLRTRDTILLEASCSTGSGGELIDETSGRRWIFSTPKGVFRIRSKLTDPWWRKPDWAFIEENQPIPNKAEDRYDPDMLGAYALGFGDNYYIHGTIYERLLGINVTHGCVRLGLADLKKLYESVSIGTPVYIF